MPTLNVELSPEVEAILNELTMIADMSSSEELMTHEDIIAISLKLYSMSFRREYCHLPAIQLFATARASWLEHKRNQEASNGTHDD